MANNKNLFKQKCKLIPLCTGFVMFPAMMQAQTSDTIVYNRTLDEVVVQTAYGSVRKSTITGAISQVESKNIEKRPVTSVTQALEGAVSGVQVNGTYAQPGSSPSINIRGIGTVNGTYAPLYVLDGVPYSGDITDINPNDIESITVLKDAASCALYGNRASNGVILLTTKQGKSGKISVDFKANFGSYAQGVKDYKRLNDRQYMELSWLNYRNTLMSGKTKMSLDEASAYASANLVKNVLKLNIYDKPAGELFDADGHLVSDANILPGIVDDLDWEDQATRTGFRQDYNLSANQRTVKSDSYFSVGYLKEEGYVNNAGFERLNGRASINYRPVSWLNAGFSAMGSHQNQNVTAGDATNNYGNVFMFARNIAPIYPVHLHDADGNYVLDVDGSRRFDTGKYGTADTRNQYANRNIIWENQLNVNRRHRNVMQGAVYATARFLDDFSLTLKADGSTANENTTIYYNSSVGDGLGSNGILRKNAYDRHTYTFQQQLNWEHRFGCHIVSALIGHENHEYTYDYSLVDKSNEITKGNTSLSNFANLTSSVGYNVKYRTESYLARVRYNYLDRYNVEASYRRDGSSRFSKDSRWGNFGSVGANWIVSKEAFMRDVNWVDNLKLRADFGQVGNDAGAGYYAYMNLYHKMAIDGEGAYVLKQLEGKNLKWETGQSFGVAIDARLFNRWNLSVEYFDKRTKNLLFYVYLPLSAGGTSNTEAASKLLQNIGTMSNRGFEINTDVDIYRNRNWRVNFAANATFTKNKVIKLPEQNKDGIQSGLYKIEEGRSLYEFYTYTFAGVDRLTGKSMYNANLDEYCIKDADGNVLAGNPKGANLAKVATEIGGKYYVNNVTYAKKEFQGSAMPTVYGSFSPSVSYRSLTVSALFTYSLGGKVYDSVYKTLMTTGSTPINQHVDILKSWTAAPDGMTADSPNRLDPHGIPQVDGTYSAYNNSESSRWLTSASYIVLKNIYASCALPKVWTRTLGLQDVRVSLACDNVFTATKRRGMNPQQSFSGSQANYLLSPRVFTVGVDVKF